MGNLITIDRFGPDHRLPLSNGGTTVLPSVPLLGGSDPAASVWEQRLMTWLAEHDADAAAVAWSWRSPPARLVKCERHRVFRHANGCLLCHDGE